MDERGEAWTISTYYSKKKRREMDALGNMVDRHENLAEPFFWDENAKLDLAIRQVSQEFDMTPDALRQRIKKLKKLVPDLSDTVLSGSLKLVDFVRMAVDLRDIAVKLTQLKLALPGANVSAMICQVPGILAKPADVLSENVHRLRVLLSNMDDPDRFIESHPQVMLDETSVELAIKETKRLFGKHANPARILECNPDLLYSSQDLRGLSRGERDSGYLDDTLLPE